MEKGYYHTSNLNDGDDTNLKSSAFNSSTVTTFSSTPLGDVNEGVLEEVGMAGMAMAGVGKGLVARGRDPSKPSGCGFAVNPGWRGFTEPIGEGPMLG